MSPNFDEFVSLLSDEQKEALRHSLDDQTQENAPQAEKPTPSTKLLICQLLTEIGVPPHLKGYNYIFSGLLALVEDPDLMCAITGELYPAVAQQHNTAPSRVERAMRHAIEVAWDRGDLEILGKYFGNTVNIEKSHPTNSEFLARCAEIVRFRRDGENV